MARLVAPGLALLLLLGLLLFSITARVEAAQALDIVEVDTDVDCAP